MQFPTKLLNPLKIEPRNSDFPGPYEIGYEQLFELFPGLNCQSITLEVLPRVEDGGISYEELVILTALTGWMQPKRVLEIGTFHGWTSHNLALQLAAEAELITINLPDGQQPRLGSDGWNAVYLPKSKSSLFFEGRQTANQIRQMVADTADLTAKDFPNQFDLVFIDGSHSFAYIENDTNLALSVVKEKAIIFWHDYGKPRDWPGVTEYLHRVSRQGYLHPLYWLHKTNADLQTSLVLHIRGLQ